MGSTFHGLETAKRGMNAQQSALYTLGHNISNANTPGYTRQRVNLSPTDAFPTPGLNSPRIPGQLGTGVKVNEIQRVRDSFTDMQFRTENSKLGYWQGKAEMLSQMEGVMNEPSDSGLAATMDKFWNALQDLAVQPQNDGARRVARERGIALADTFNYISDSLKAIQNDYRSEISSTQNKANSILRQINSINKEIQAVEPNGLVPNDLYDQRDLLVDELSSIVNIKVVARPSGGNASAAAEGVYDIYMATPKGEILKDSNGEDIKLVNSETGTATGIHVQYQNRPEANSPVTSIKFFDLNENQGFAGIADELAADAANSKYILNDIEAIASNGSLKGFIEGYGYTSGTGDETVTKGLYNDMLAEIDQMAYTFAQHFNLVHSSGWSLNEIRNGARLGNNDFFTVGDVKGAASSIKVADHIIKDAQNIAAASEGNVLAGMMKRESGKVNPETAGNPFLSGIYDFASAPANNNIPEDAKEIAVTVQYNGSGWDYTFTADGDNATATTFSSTDDEATIFGIDFNLSHIDKQQTGDQWTFSFKAEGIKPTDEAFIGNGSNALKLADVKDTVLNFDGNLTNVQSFYQGMIGKLGENASEANRMTTTAASNRNSVEQRRMSTSSVSLDEEMTNMIKFQHAYNAAARNITMVDEMLDKIINGMGVGGR